MEGTL